MNEALALLRTNPVLAGAEARALEQLARHCTVRCYERRALVVRQEAPQQCVFLVARGGIALHRRNQRSQILIGMLSTPAIFGDAELYARQPWSVSARAATQSVLVAIPSDVFERFVAANPSVAYGLYRETCARHFLVVQLLHRAQLASTPDRLLSVLLESAVTREDGTRDVRYAPVLLSHALGVDRKTIYRTVRDLEERGLVERTGEPNVLRLTVSAQPLGSFGFGAAWRLPPT